MTSSSDRSNEDFEREWREIARGLADIEEPTEPIAPPSREPRRYERPFGGHGRGPRDWNPASDDEVEPSLAEDDDLSYRRASGTELAVAHPSRAVAWLGAFVLMLAGIGVGAGIVPAPPVVAGALLCAGFAVAALAAFLSARKGDDPFDDGARL